MLSQAFNTANEAHKGQKRRSGSPYIEHPVKVAHLLMGLFPFDTPLICAGYLHDVLEDTDISKEYIQNHFGSNVLSLVEEVTNNTDEYEKFDGKVGYQLDRMKSMSSRALLLKMCDIFSNVSDLFSVPSKYLDWYIHYAEGKKFILENIVFDKEDRYISASLLLSSVIKNMIMDYLKYVDDAFKIRGDLK
jgi:(p)ppGpp synthase/HD superfamily hydrolase